MTCLGINNEGYLRYDYYHEDLGQNDKVDQTYVFNSYDSLLWNNFSEVFQDEIQKTYSSWRSGDNPLLSYDKVIKYFITDQSDQWSISIYNEDAEFKYISLYRNNDNPEFLYQVRGTGEEHLKYFIKNRLMYCDSKWQAGDFVNKDTNTILLRLNSPDGIADEEIQPDITIKYRTFSNMYAGVRYGTNGFLNSKYTDKGELVEFKMPEGEDPNNLDTYIYGANEISELEDLSLLYCNLINISPASKLTKLVVGNSHPNYRNDVLKTLSFSNNRLLKEVNVCNCTGLTGILDFSLCPDIQYVYATGSKIAGVQLPKAGFLKKLYLPDSISNLTITNQHHIEEFECEGYSNLTTIKIEDSINMPIQDILLGCDSSTLASVSIRNIDWNVDSEENLQQIIDKLITCKGSIIEGSVYLPSGVTISDDLKITIHQNFPNLNVIDDSPVFYIDYYNYDNTIWDTETVQANHDAVGPEKGEPDDIIQELQGLRHLFVRWKTLPTNVTKNHQIDAIWQTQYSMKYYSEAELVYEYWANQGTTAKDPVDYSETGLDDMISIPSKEGTDIMRYAFVGWDNLPQNIQKSAVITAMFANLHPVHYKTPTTIHYTQWVIEGQDAYDPIAANECDTPTDIITANEKKLVFSSWDSIPTNITAVTEVNATYDAYWAARFLNDGELYLLEWVLEGTDVVEPKDYFENYTNPTRKSTAQYNFVFSHWEGEWDNITERRSFEATYRNVTRTYDVYFYYAYGDKEPLAVVNVLYGSKATYPKSDPVKEGEYKFIGWSPDPSNITGETKCYALFKFTGQIKDDWATISAHAKNGTASEVYEIGGRKEIVIGDIVLDVEIIAFNHDNLTTNGSQKAGITFFCKDLPNIQSTMRNQSSNSENVCWQNCEVRSYLNDELFEQFPAEVKSVIQPVYKISDGGVNNPTLMTTHDYLWLASCEEVGISKETNGNTSISFIAGQGTEYSSVFNAKETSREKTIIFTSQTSGWWTRTANHKNSASYIRITASGGTYGDNNTTVSYIPFGFCI